MVGKMLNSDNTDINVPHMNVAVILCFQDMVEYAITGGSRAMEYYYINPSSGVILLKKLLSEGTQVSDEVGNNISSDKIVVYGWFFRPGGHKWMPYHPSGPPSRHHLYINHHINTLHRFNVLQCHLNDL